MEGLLGVPQPLPANPNGHRQHFDPKLLKSIAQVLVDQHDGHWAYGKRDDQGSPRRKVRHSCVSPQHYDPNPSADFYPDDGWYYCHGTCARAFPVPKVAEWLDIEMPRPRKAGASPHQPNNPSPFYQRGLGEPTAIYPYCWPDGRLSHFKVRWGHGKTKQIRWLSADYSSWRKPETWWPIYDAAPPPGANIIPCEGEKAVDRINKAGETYDGAPIVAMTAGSAVDCLNAIPEWVARIVALKPARVLIWPDFDRHMAEWTTALLRELKGTGIKVRRVEPRRTYPEIPPGGGPDDFMDARGTLERVFRDRFADALSDPRAMQFLDELELYEGFQARIPHTRSLLPVKKENMGALWTAMHGDSIPRGLIDPAFDRLRAQDPASHGEVVHRRWHDGDCTQLVWRGDNRSKAAVVNASGITWGDDPPRTLILTHRPPPGSYGTEVDMEGHLGHLVELCLRYGLDVEHAMMLEGWLACAMIGLSTPILLLRGEAGTGKTTFAKALLSVIEPACPGLQLDDDRNIDPRGLINTLRQSVGVIMDNVGGLTANAENRLCRIVTGDSTSQRRMYGEDIDMFALRRAIVMTSISWEPRKSDLRDRILPVTLPYLERKLADSTMAEEIRYLLPRIRGYLFTRIARYYQQVARYRDEGGELRIADWGRYLAVMGVDTSRLVELVQGDRRRQLDDGDNWVQAVVDFRADHWEGKSPGKGDFFRATARDIISFMRAEDVEPPYSASSHFRKWMEENNPRWREYGFAVRYLKSNEFRGYEFKNVR